MTETKLMSAIADVEREARAKVQAVREEAAEQIRVARETAEARIQDAHKEARQLRLRKEEETQASQRDDLETAKLRAGADAKSLTQEARTRLDEAVEAVKARSVAPDGRR